MKARNGLRKEKLSDRPQLNFRVKPALKESVQAEIARQGRKGDAVADRVWTYFLSLKTTERDAICAKAA